MEQSEAPLLRRLTRRRALARGAAIAAGAVGTSAAAAAVGATPAAAAPGDPVLAGQANDAGDATTKLTNGAAGAITLDVHNTGTGSAVRAMSEQGTNPALWAHTIGTGPALVAISTQGVGVIAEGATVPLWLRPGSSDGPPDLVANPGKVWVDRRGRTWVAVNDFQASGSGVMWVRPGFNPITPFRVCDTRPGRGTPYSSGPVGPAGNLLVTVAAGDSPVPFGATAVVLNLTVTGATQGSYLTLFPQGEPRPVASAINFTAGQTIANGLTMPVGLEGQIHVYNNEGSVHVIIDLMGFFF